LDLRNPGLKQRHWDRIQDVLGTRAIRDKTFTLGMLLDLNAIDVKEQIANISLEATKEALLEDMIKKVENVWATLELQVTAHGKDVSSGKDVGRDALYIISGVEDIVTQLEDSQVAVGTIKGSRYIGPIKNVRIAQYSNS
jgi:dynein heavy chain, axonemal